MSNVREVSGTPRPAQSHFLVPIFNLKPEFSFAAVASLRFFIEEQPRNLRLPPFFQAIRRIATRSSEILDITIKDGRDCLPYART
ncbi:MAG: hypothetical protein GTO18_08025 [Anaerolineales bacterium]|nr:hypothetical protein [Anaerolineales bacterium]